MNAATALIERHSLDILCDRQGSERLAAFLTSLVADRSVTITRYEHRAVFGCQGEAATAEAIPAKNSAYAGATTELPGRDPNEGETGRSESP